MAGSKPRGRRALDQRLPRLTLATNPCVACGANRQAASAQIRGLSHAQHIPCDLSQKRLEALWSFPPKISSQYDSGPLL